MFAFLYFGHYIPLSEIGLRLYAGWKPRPCVGGVPTQGLRVYILHM